ncbi:MAG: neutral/alkaline non-lysosomal ceramidase N-terminal domain-containing protein [Planctomycetes bacterium]|nr:neutral/alkaline non-lysosomal ceramidase N-terminal domain-containing protein [Planctomycetota bacterium]
MSKTTITVACLFLQFVIGCSSISGTLPKPGPNPPAHAGMLRVGASKTDITPVPGVPMGGDALAGRISRGVWMRLKSRAVYFEDPTGEAAVFIICDLWSMPGGLGDRVAEIVSSEYHHSHVSRERILIAATHTHNSPGAFSTCTAMNVLATPEAAFDRELFEWLARRIACGVDEAIRNAEPAILQFGAGDTSTLARNRSYLAFIKNGKDATDLLAENATLPIQTPPTPFPVEKDCANKDGAYRAFDPRLRTLFAYATAADHHLIGAVSCACMHPTSMGPKTEVYSSDLFGVATDFAESQFLQKNPEARPPVVALFNGTEGDVASNWKTQDRRSALHIGREIGDRISKSAAGARDVDQHLQTGSTIVNFKDVAKPLVGVAFLGGGEGDPVIFHDMGSYEGIRATGNPDPNDPQWPKLSLLEPYIRDSGVREFTQNTALSILDLPDHARVTAICIGNILFASLPGEFTTILGRQTEKQYKSAFFGNAPAPDAEVVLLGLANEYLTYWTTHEEYKLQNYEAASMIYGPKAADVLRSQTTELLRDIKDHKIVPRTEDLSFYYKPLGLLPEVASYVGFVKRHCNVDAFSFLHHTERLHASYDSLANVLVTDKDCIPMPNHPHFAWLDENPDYASGRPVCPRVSIEYKTEEMQDWKLYTINGRAEDDETGQFVTIVSAELRGKSRWLTYWLRPLDEWKRADPNPPKVKYRFHVVGVRGDFYSHCFDQKLIDDDDAVLPFQWDAATPNAMK